nr:hypothetical protein [Tanacetum cinerariifolium]
MEIPNEKINDAIKKKVRYKYYMAKKVESKKAKMVGEPEEQRVSLVKRRRGKGFMSYGDQVVNVSKLKKDVVQRKTRSLTIIKETVVASRLEILKQKKQAAEGEGSSATHNKYYDSSNTNSEATLYSLSSDKIKESVNETDDADDSDMDLFDDDPHGDDDATCSSIDFIQTFLDKTPANELTNFMSHPVYTDAQTTSVEMFPDENAHHLSSPSATKMSYPIKIPTKLTPIQSKEAEAKGKKEYEEDQFQEGNKEDEYVRKHPYPEWFPKKSRLAKKTTTWFDLLLKSNIDQNKNHVLRPSTVAIAKKLKAIIQKDDLTIADLKGAGLERLKQQYQNDVELEYHVSQLKAVVSTEAKWNSDKNNVLKPRTFKRHMLRNTKPHPSFYNNNFYYLVCLSTKRRRFADKEYEFSYADLPRLSLNDVEDMYLLQVQYKLHHLLLEFVKDFNNALLLYIRRVMIQNRVKDIQLGVESQQQTLNLTTPIMFFEGIDQKITFTMSGTHKGFVYLNQHNIKSFMKLSEVKKFYDGTLIKIRENLVDMVKRTS